MRFGYWSGDKIVTKLIYFTHKSKVHKESVPFHRHPPHEILIVDTGNIEIGLKDGSIYHLEAGDCLFIKRSCFHQIRFKARTANFINILYRGKSFESLYQAPVRLNSSVYDLLGRIKAECVPPLTPLKSEIICVMLSEFILRCLIQQEETDREIIVPIEPLNKRFYRSEMVRDLTDSIRKNPAGDYSLDTLSRKYSMCTSQLRKLVSAETGRNFSTTLHKLRIDAAKKHLRESSDSIKEIAEKCGFNSIPFFYKIFNRYTDMTPLEYAKSFGDVEE